MPELPGQERFDQEQDEQAVEQRPVQLAAAARPSAASRGQFFPVGQMT